MPLPNTYISLGKGNRLLSEDYYLSQFSGLGITKRAFRKWCRSMQVPLVIFPGNRAFVDLFTFKMALRAISRLGRPDFFLPTTDSWNPRTKEYTGPSTLEPEYLETHWKELVSELVAARLEPNSPQRRELKQAAEEAVKVLLAGRPNALIQAEKDRVLKKVTKYAESEGVFKEFTHA